MTAKKPSTNPAFDEDDAPALFSPLTGEMQRQRRFPDAAFLVQERDDHGRPPRLGRP